MAKQKELKIGKIKKKKRWAIIAVVCVAVIVAGVIFAVKRPKQQEITYAYIRTTTLNKGSLEDSISTTGTVESAETANVTTDLSYPVKSVNVAVGDSVKVGDVICTLDTSDLESQIAREQESLAKSQSSAQDSYDTAKENYDTAKKNVSEAKQALTDAETEKNTAYLPYKEALSAIKSYQSAYDTALAAYEKAGAKYVSALKDYNTAVSQYKKGKITETELVKSAKAYMKTVQDYYGGCDIGTYDISDSSSSTSEGTGAGNGENSQVASVNLSQTYTGLLPYMALSMVNTISVSETAKDICDNVAAQVKSLSGKRVSYSEGTNTLYKLSKKAASLRDAKLQCNYDSLASAYSVAENAYDLAEQSYEQCEEALSQAESQLEQAEEQVSEAASSDTLEDLESQLEECEIKANQDGTITALNVTVGSSVNAMNAVATISSLDNLKVSVTISEADINTAQIGMSCYITSDASDETLNGTLTQLDPVASEGGSFGAEVTVDSTTETLHIGMNASVEIIVSSTEDVYQVPIDAVGNDEDGLGDYIYRKTGGEGTDMTFEKVYITTGEKNDYYIEVASDELQEGDVIRSTADLTAGVETSDSSEDTNLTLPFGEGEIPSGNEEREGGRSDNGSFEKGDMPAGGGPTGNSSGGGKQ